MSLVGDIVRTAAKVPSPFAPLAQAATNYFPQGAGHQIAQQIAPYSQSLGSAFANYVAPSAYASTQTNNVPGVGQDPNRNYRSAEDQAAFQQFDQQQQQAAGDYSSGSFGAYDNPDLSNDFKRQQYEAWKASQVDHAAEARNAINSGYDNYFKSLDDILNTSLPQQRTAQEGIIGSQFEQGQNTLNTQQTQGLADLDTTRRKTDTQQSKTLADLGDNIRNLFQAGNVYLGARGAGDSSAANQYAYGLTKMGTKQRGDVTAQYAEIQNDINDREFKLKTTVESELRNLQSERDQKVLQVSQWFSEQQQALKQAQAQGQLQKGQDLAALSQNLLNVALQQLQTVQQESSNRRSALEQWAMNNATNITQLKQNLAGISQTNYNMPSAQPVAGAPSVDSRGNLFAGGFNAGTDEKRNIFGARV
jgi:hypothetical protein